MRWPGPCSTAGSCGSGCPDLCPGREAAPGEQHSGEDHASRSLHASQPRVEAFDIPVLYGLRQHAVGRQRGRQPREVAPRQRHQPDRRPERREGDRDAEGHDREGHRHHGPRSAALDEGDLARADHVYDERLRQQPLDEPPRLEERLHLRRPALEEVPHQQVGRQVEDRADRPDPDHEAAQPRGVPLARFAQVFGIHAVEGDRRLRDVVQEVLHQQVDGHHRQERQEGAGRHHAEHVAEVRTGRHLDVLDDVAEGPAPLDNPLPEHHQILLEQDDVGALLGDVHGRIDRYADVRLAQGRRVVDAVAEESHRMLRLLQQGDDLRLLQRRDLREDRSLLHGPAQLLALQLLEFAAGEGLARDAHLAGDGAHHGVVVAREHLHLDAVVLQLADGACGRGLRRIEEGEEADEHHVALVPDREVVLLAEETAVGDGQHAQPLVVHPFADRLCRRNPLGGELPHGAALLGVRADLEHLLHGPLGDDLPLARAVLDDHRHAAAREVERNLVHLAVVVLHRLQLQLPDVGEDGPVHEVLQPRLEEAVEVGVAEDAPAVVGAAVGVDVAFEHDLVAGQRPGLVRAENVHRPEVLDRVQVLDDHLLARHGDSSLREVCRDDHRQHLGREPDGHRHGEDEGLQPVALGDAIDQEDERHHDEHEADEQQAHPGDAPVERRGRTVADDGPGDRTQVGVAARPEDDGRGRSADDVRPHVADVVQFDHASPDILPAPGVGSLLDRLRLAGQRRLADEEVLGLDDPHVGRDHVPGGERDDVARHELLDRELLDLAPRTLHRAGVLHHLPERLARPAGPPVLAEADDDAQQDHRRNDQDRRPLLLLGGGRPDVEDIRDDDQQGQNPDERVDERPDEHRHGVLPPFVLDLVPAVLRLTALHLVGRKPRGGRPEIPVHRGKRLCCCQEYLPGIKCELCPASFFPHNRLF